MRILALYWTLLIMLIAECSIARFKTQPRASPQASLQGGDPQAAATAAARAQDPPGNVLAEAINVFLFMCLFVLLSFLLMFKIY